MRFPSWKEKRRQKWPEAWPVCLFLRSGVIRAGKVTMPQVPAGGSYFQEGS